MRLRVGLLILGAVALVALPSPSRAAAPDLDAWLMQHPSIANALVWTFPNDIPDLPDAPSPEGGRISRPAPSPWMMMKVKTPARTGGISPQLQDVTQALGAPPSPPPGWSCPIPIVSPNLGKTLMWCQWPEAYRQRMKGYFQTYWNWMETSSPLYQQYKESGFAVKPAGFDERFASTIDPETSAEPGVLPFSFTVMKDLYTHVLYEPVAAVDLYLKTTALQLVLETGPFLGWKLTPSDDADLAVILDGRNLFRYFPAGSRPWGGQQIADKEGYESSYALPAPPLALMKFLMREGILRDTRFETVARLLEWERGLQHAMGSPQTLTGECGKEFHEVYWGTKGSQPLARILSGTVMACPLVAQPGSTNNGYYSAALTRYTGGCGTTGGIHHRVLRQINVAAETVAFSHGQTRFVVERIPFEQMSNALEPLLPPDPAIDDGLLHLHPSYGFSQHFASGDGAEGRSRSFLAAPMVKTSPLADVYIDHNDNPYGMAALTDIPVKEALISEATYQRWFAQPPDFLTDAQETAYRAAHNERVGLRVTQLRIARLPLQLFRYYCWKEDEGKPREQTETYLQFLKDYTPAELEATGFWTRFDQKLSDLGGCDGVPPL